MTKSGASPAGLTATLQFTGTQVAVFGSQGSVDVDGQPTTTYTIDGVLEGTYTAPVINPGFFTSRTQFFSSGQLTAGSHSLVIETTNGTRPNRYWLDWIQYVPSAGPAPPSQPPSSPTTQQQSSPSSIPSSPSNSPTSDPPTTQNQQEAPSTPAPNSTPPSSISTTSQQSLSQSPSSSSSSSHSSAIVTTLAGSSGGSSVIVTLIPTSSATNSATNGTLGNGIPQDASGATSTSSHTPVGAIAGGVIGGIVVIAVVALLFFFCRRRRGQSLESPEPLPIPSDGTTSDHPDIAPFGSWRFADDHPEPERSEKQSLFSNSRTFSPSSRAVDDPFASPTSIPVTPSTAPSVTGSDAYTGMRSQSQSHSRTASSSAVTSARPTTPSDSEKMPIRVDARGPLPAVPGSSSQLAVHAQPRIAPLLAEPLQPHLEEAMTPIVKHHEDSGVRFPPPGQRPVVEMPPAYSRA